MKTETTTTVETIDTLKFDEKLDEYEKNPEKIKEDEKYFLENWEKE